MSTTPPPPEPLLPRNWITGERAGQIATSGEVTFTFHAESADAALRTLEDMVTWGIDINGNPAILDAVDRDDDGPFLLYRDLSDAYEDRPTAIKRIRWVDVETVDVW